MEETTDTEKRLGWQSRCDDRLCSQAYGAVIMQETVDTKKLLGW